MKLAHLRLGLGRRTACDVLFLRSGQVTELEPHLAPHRYVDLEYGSRRVILHPVFLFFLLVNLIKYSTQRAFLKTYVQFYRTTSVISYDNIPGAWDWADVLEWPMISVQHGMRQMEELNVESAPTTNVVFLSWGNLQIEDYRLGRTPRLPNSSHERTPRSTIPIGSLRDSMYRALDYRPVRKHDQICVISQFKGLSGIGLALPEQRQKNLDAMLAHVKRYAQESSCTVAIALYAKKQPKRSIEMDWYRSIFGDSCVFNDPTEDFATYKLVDESSIALGVHTSVLWEVFGRRQKMLACNFTGERIFEFPVLGPWYLTDGDYQSFKSRLDMLRGLSIEGFQELVGDRAEHVVAYDPGNPTHVAIGRLIEDQKANPSLR